MSEKGFKETLLDDVLEFYNGKSIKAAEDGLFPVYGSNGVIGKTDEFKYSNAVIIGRVGAYCGSIEYCQGKFWASDNTIVAKGKDSSSNIKYLFYLMKNMNLNRYAGGSAQPLMTQTTLKQIPTKLPPLPTQRKIASILSAYDDLIENNTHRIKILEEMAQTIYKEWFVKFRFPGHEKAKMVDSELGTIPEGWEVKRLGVVVELAYGKALKKDDRRDGPFPVYGSGGVVGYHDEYLVQCPGIIVGRKGNVGSVYWSQKSFYPIDTVFFVKTNVSLYYLYYNLKEQNFINTDAAVPGLSRNQAYLNEFLLPPNDILHLFAKFASPIFSQIEILHSQIENLRRTRDLLLPKLISGEVDVTALDLTMEGSEV